MALKSMDIVQYTNLKSPHVALFLFKTALRWITHRYLKVMHPGESTSSGKTYEVDSLIRDLFMLCVHVNFVEVSMKCTKSQSVRWIMFWSWLLGRICFTHSVVDKWGCHQSCDGLVNYLDTGVVCLVHKRHFRYILCWPTCMRSNWSRSIVLYHTKIFLIFPATINENSAFCGWSYMEGADQWMSRSLPPTFAHTLRCICSHWQRCCSKYMPSSPCIPLTAW